MSQPIIASFKRYEVKFFMTPAQREALMPELLEHFCIDEYGKHTISNLYFDTDTYDIIRTSIEKPIYKEKLRVRAYGVPQRGTGQVFVELKKKYDHIVYKRRIAAPVGEAMDFLTGGSAPQGVDQQIAREIAHFQEVHNHPVPKVYLSYDRIAMFGKENSALRITLDQNLLWRDTNLDLCSGSYGQHIIPRDLTLMEIKVPGAMPLWLSHALCKNEIYRTSFSKIGTCYKEFILPKAFPSHVAAAAYQLPGQVSGPAFLPSPAGNFA